MPEAAQIGTIEPVFIGTMRAPDTLAGDEFSFKRAREVRFARVDVSVPPDRKTGKITWPPRGRPADPRTQFVVSSQVLYADDDAFRSDLHRALSSRGTDAEAIIFVHGFNNTFAEGTYRLAQLGHDLDSQAALVHFSWPSRGNPLAYVYDRDSVQYTRDGLEQLIDDVVAAGARRVIIVGHSLGGFLVMETLRQMALERRTDLLDKLGGIVLMSPDIDVDVFHEQSMRMGKLPQPFVIFTSRRDRALALSARLTGQPDRLGNISDARQVEDLDVTLVDVTAFSVGEGHFNVGNSPALLSLLGNIVDVDTAFAGERAGQAGLVGGLVLSVQSATRIILSPGRAIGIR